jgi:hypothetical protein
MFLTSRMEQVAMTRSVALQRIIIVLIAVVGTFYHLPAQGQASQNLKNMRARVPSMGEGPGDWVQFRNGLGVKTEAVPYAQMRSVATGRIGNVPTSVAHVTWNTGGSGNWSALLMFVESKGKQVQVGTFTHYIGSTDKLEIKNNRIFVHLDSEDANAFKGMSGVKLEGKGWISMAPKEFEK